MVDVHYFPEADDPIIAPFAQAFIRMMFAHAELEASIRDLQGALMDDKWYGEKIHPWTARDQPKLMHDLIVEKCGSIPEAGAAKDCLTGAIPLYDDRNHLAHGQWWAFDRKTGTIKVRRGRQFPDKDQHKEFSVDDIGQIAIGLWATVFELYQIERAIKALLKRDWD